VRFADEPIVARLAQGSKRYSGNDKAMKSSVLIWDTMHTTSTDRYLPCASGCDPGYPSDRAPALEFRQVPEQTLADTP